MKDQLVSENLFGITVTRRSHNLVAPYIKEGDTVVDATLGNGSDAAFLAERIGPDGTLYGFDIQKEAVEMTRKRLSAEKQMSSEPKPAKCKLLLFTESHDRMDELIKEAPSVIMFNLGYLPGGDKEITTVPETTLPAIRKGLSLLKNGGIMSIVTYKGHPGAMEEHRLVTDFLAKLSPKEFEVLSFIQTNRSEATPELHLIQKTPSSAEAL